MKKSTIVLSSFITLICLTAYGINKWNTPTCQPVCQPAKNSCAPVAFATVNDLVPMCKKADFDLFCKVDSRFMTTISKDDLNNAKSIVDILPVKHTRTITRYEDVRIGMVGDDKLNYEPGNNEMLTTAQKALLSSFDYATNFIIWANYERLYDSGFKGYNKMAFSISITPEHKAQYNDGEKALLSYLKTNSQAQCSSIKEGTLQPGQVSFTVSKTGDIVNPTITSTSGYPMLDYKLHSLMSNLPGHWSPATDAQGEPVSQNLVLFFGHEGC
ncbi:MAG: hypothetical protein HKO66_06395 [Saprospiraceae bacterium]|nr:hypothetical protein [Saprospiraceae bacterium]